MKKNFRESKRGDHPAAQSIANVRENRGACVQMPKHVHECEIKLQCVSIRTKNYGSTSFTFTPANWDTWQTLTIQAAAGSAGRLSSANLRLRGDALVIDALPSLSASSTGTNSSYQTWLATNSLPTDGTGDGAPTANPSGDGVVNALKFALGLGAGDVGYAGRLDSQILNVSGAEYIALTYTRPEPGPAGVGYAVKVSDDLTIWNAAQTVEVSNDVAGGLRTITVRDTQAIGPSAPRRFIRLEVTQP